MVYLLERVAKIGKEDERTKRMELKISQKGGFGVVSETKASAMAYHWDAITLA